MNFQGESLFQTTKLQLNGGKLDVGHFSAFGSVVLLFCFWVQCLEDSVLYFVLVNSVLFHLFVYLDLFLER